jgi:hypothetical protein
LSDIASSLGTNKQIKENRGVCVCFITAWDP